MTANLINPFIIYWDVNPALSEDDILRICGELVDAKIFVLELRDLSSPLSGAAKIVLDRLKSEQIKINITVGKDLHAQSIEALGGLQVFIEFDSFEKFQFSLDEILDRINQGYTIGVSFSINKTNFSELPAFIASCIENSINNIRFPIQRADDKEIFCPDPEDSRRLSGELNKLDMGSLDLSIHDPFLWKLIHDKDNPNEDGCNGAKTMMYISGDLDVTPCPIMPYSMGNLSGASLKKICSSEERRQVRMELSKLPQECVSCDSAGKCRGGCRGRTYVLFNKFSRKDPACLI
jgi:GeoRSP system SPASM domain protein